MTKSAKILADRDAILSGTTLTVGEAVFLHENLPGLQGALKYKEARRIMDKIADGIQSYNEVLARGPISQKTLTKSKGATE